MINSRDPIHEWERRTLSVASRDRWHGLVTRINWFEVFEIGPAAHGGNGRRFAEPGESEGQVSEMRMNDVEVVGALVYVREHRELQEGSKILLAPGRSACWQAGCNLALVCASPAPNSVTS
jgi:hypothetical protein